MIQAHGWGGVVDVSPIRSCQKLSEDRIQTLGQERPGQPAVTSLTLAETIHLAERGPPRVERSSPDPRRRAHEGRNAHTHTSRRGNKHPCACNDIHGLLLRSHSRAD